MPPRQLLRLAKPQHKDAKIRGEAAWTLGKSGDALAVRPLIQALEDDDRNVRQWSVLALLKMGCFATQELIGLLKAGTNQCLQAAAALGQINDSSAVEPLSMALLTEQ